MSFSARIVVEGGDQLRATILGRTAALADFTPVLKITGAIARDSAKVRIRTEGANMDPPWIPSLKTRSITLRGKHGLGTYTVQGSGGRTGFDLGTMSNSIEFHLTSPTQVEIGTNVPYAKYFQLGTGIYNGRQPWTIRPVAKRALSWTFGGRRFFARSVTIKGQPPRPFLLFDKADVDAIVTEWRKYLTGAAT